MSDRPSRPRLRRIGAGMYATVDERFVVLDFPDGSGWGIGQGDRWSGDDTFMATYSDLLLHFFPTRREALDALALALHLEGSS
jgi:hypothetical protein